MGAEETNERIPEASPQPRARIAGLFYLLTFLTGAFAAFLGGKMMVYSDAASLVASACYGVVTLLFHGLFKPVDASLSLIAAAFSLAGCVLGVLGVLHFVPSYISSFNPLVLFGVYCLMIGYLILQSTFLPRILGLLMAFAGLGKLTFILPELANYLFPYNLAPGILGEGALTVWLLVARVNAERWRAQAGAAGQSRSWRL